MALKSERQVQNIFVLKWAKYRGNVSLGVGNVLLLSEWKHKSLLRTGMGFSFMKFMKCTEP